MEIPEWIRYALAALAGGSARYLQAYIEGRPFDFRRMIASIIVAGFCGTWIAMITSHLYPDFSSVVAGGAGWLGAEGVRWLLKQVMRKFEKEDKKTGE